MNAVVICKGRRVATYAICSQIQRLIKHPYVIDVRVGWNWIEIGLFPEKAKIKVPYGLSRNEMEEVINHIEAIFGIIENHYNEITKVIQRATEIEVGENEGSSC